MTAPASMLSPAALDSLAALARSAPPGPFVEVGVYKGGSAAVLYGIAQEQGRGLYLYDTFEGTPYSHPAMDRNPKGSFADTDVEKVRRMFPQAHVVKGVFPGNGVVVPDRVAFVHADADQYESTLAICRIFPPYMAEGGMILFDDYGVSGCDGATYAVDKSFAGLAAPRLERVPETGKMIARF